MRLKFSDVICKMVVYNKKCDEMMEKAKRKRNDIEKFETCNSILVGGLENKANFDLLLQVDKLMNAGVVRGCVLQYGMD